MIGRRRFLHLAAAAAGAVAGFARPAQAAEWRGVALGADVSLRLTGRGADAAIRDLPPLLRRIEGTFSLHAASELARLNADGGGALSGWMARALSLCADMHRVTQGLFDPTVQPLWRALADGGDVAAAAAAVGWGRVRLSPDALRLDAGQALTLNGMAQGFAADLVRDWLAARGFGQAVVDMGETAALGGPFRIGLADLGDVTLRGTALAVSVPAALLVGGRSHILHPSGGAPRWRTVAVEADSAAVADALSTALALADPDQARAIGTSEGVRRVWLGDAAGGLSQL
ncbi:MAG: hypothetical protein RIR62_54 [Pseudomonadota bacterium]|jgi:thiamine biosynthesis lipoprotein